MNAGSSPRWLASVLLSLCGWAGADEGITVKITVDRGRDLGQCFGSLFEAPPTLGVYGSTDWYQW